MDFYCRQILDFTEARQSRVADFAPTYNPLLASTAKLRYVYKRGSYGRWMSVSRSQRRGAEVKRFNSAPLCVAFR